MQLSNESPFSELPEALVEEMLGRSDQLSIELTESLSRIRSRREEFHESLENAGLLRNSADIIGSPNYPTSCGVDGSYAIEKLLTTDMIVAAALAVEGLTPPNEKRFWPRPHHLVLTNTIPHSESTNVILRGIMVAMELGLTVRAPHDVVFIDGSLVTPLIYLNQCLHKSKEAPSKIKDELHRHMLSASESYTEILNAERSDKEYVGIPKYTTKNEIGSRLGSEPFEDRALLSFVLKPGELTAPLKSSRAERTLSLAN